MTDLFKLLVTIWLFINFVRIIISCLGDLHTDFVNAYIRFKRWCRKVKVAIRTDHELSIHFLKVYS